jgi:hypothetical protein
MSRPSDRDLLLAGVILMVWTSHRGSRTFIEKEIPLPANPVSMGFEILYCARCGDRVLSGDFGSGRAFRVGLRPICSGCIRRELAAIVTVPERPLIVHGLRRIRRRRLW